MACDAVPTGQAYQQYNYNLNDPNEGYMLMLPPNPNGGAPDSGTQREIKDSLQNFPCAQSILSQLTTLKNDIATKINESFGSNSKNDMIFLPKAYPSGSLIDGEHIPKIRFNNGYNYNDGYSMLSKIYINEDVLNFATKEFILVTMYHEALHGFLSAEKQRLSSNFSTVYPGVNPLYINDINGNIDLTKAIFVDNSHSAMGINFANKLSDAIRSFNPTVSKELADAMASAGIFNQSNSSKILNQNERDVRNNNYQGTKCP